MQHPPPGCAWLRTVASKSESAGFELMLSSLSLGSFSGPQIKEQHEDKLARSDTAPGSSDPRWRVQAAAEREDSFNEATLYPGVGPDENTAGESASLPCLKSIA